MKGITVENTEIRDLLYFDHDKAASLLSQVAGGLLEHIEVQKEDEKQKGAGGNVGIAGIAGLKGDLNKIQRSSTIEAKILHHDLLLRIEKELASRDLVADMIHERIELPISTEKIHGMINNKPYVSVEGWAVIEDYRRMAEVAANFNDIYQFVQKSTLENMKKSPEYLELQDQIDSMKLDIKNEKDRNLKAKKKEQLNSLNNTIERTFTTNLEGVEEWIIDGIKNWIELFMPTRINFRIYPYPEVPAFQVICNLKRECFVDQDLQHLLYGYGNRPNIPLAAIGLITSFPKEEDDRFDPLTEFHDEDELQPEVAFEKAFRGVFAGMDGMEDFVRYSRYPNITMHPIAVFRRLE